MNKKPIVFFGIAIVLLVIVAARVYFVNSEAVTIDEKHYQMGEWVDLDGAFTHKRLVENTEGYSIRVNSAKKMSYNEYVIEYGKDPTKTSEGFDGESIVCLEMELENSGNDDGQLMFFEFKLVPARKNEYFVFSHELWAESEPSMEGANFISLVKDSTYTIFLPYKKNIIDTDEHKEYKEGINDTSFGLVVSNSPTRNIIDIDIPS